MIEHVLIDESERISYEYSQTHQALDLVGTSLEVVSFEDGIVELVVSNVTGTNLNSVGTATYGNFVKIRHSNGQKTLYAHLKNVYVSAGDNVLKGEKIGVMGSTGLAYGVHLHFEVRNSDETRENPYDYLTGLKQIRAPNNTLNNSENELIDTFRKKTYEETNLSYLSNYDYEGCSIVDALKDIGVDSRYENRALLALKNNISNYSGTAYQNLKMLFYLKNGTLIV